MPPKEVRDMAQYTPETMTRKQLRSCYNRFFISFLLCMVLVQLTATALSAGIQLWLLKDPAHERWSAVLQVALNDISCYLPPLIVFPLLLGKLPSSPALPKDPLDPWELLQAVVVCMGVGYLFSLLTSYIITAIETLVGSSSQNFVSEFETSLPFWLTVMSFAVLAPFFEEVIFRGILLHRLRGLGDTSAVLLSALAFAFFHLNLYQLAYAFVLGILFACITLLTGSIRDTFLLHAIINGSSVFVDHYEALQKPFYTLVLVLILVGLLMFLRNAKHYHLEPGPLPFSKHEKRRACLRSPWFLLTVLLSLLVSVVSVFV